MLTVAGAVAECPLFDGIEPRHLALIAGCGRFTRFAAGETIFQEGEPADRFYLLRAGTVALEGAGPGRGRMTIQALHAGEPLGWSWLFPPYRWHLDAVARDAVAAVAFDGACLRGKCAEDHELGYQLMSRFARVMLARLIAHRRQLLDICEPAEGAIG